MSKREKEILEKSLKILIKELRPKRIYLFGSRAKGKTRPGSDFDFAIDGRSPNVTKMWEIKDQIDEIAGLYSIDIIFLSKVDPKFKDLVLQTAKVLYEKG